MVRRKMSLTFVRFLFRYSVKSLFFILSDFILCSFHVPWEIIMCAIPELSVLIFRSSKVGC